jgi:hypothetical protein
LVEQLICNQQVVGSIPTAGSINQTLRSVLKKVISQMIGFIPNS